MSSELDDVARSLYNGHIPEIWLKLAPDTLKSLGNWMLHFLKRQALYDGWVSVITGPLWTVTVHITLPEETGPV